MAPRGAWASCSFPRSLPVQCSPAQLYLYETRDKFATRYETRLRIIRRNLPPPAYGARYGRITCDSKLLLIQFYKLQETLWSECMHNLNLSTPSVWASCPYLYVLWFYVLCDLWQLEIQSVALARDMGCTRSGLSLNTLRGCAHADAAVRVYGGRNEPCVRTFMDTSSIIEWFGLERSFKTMWFRPPLAVCL